MKPAALLCLIALTACARSDPAGTIQPTDKGATEISGVENGDSPPFRLVGGDMTVFYMLDDDDISFDVAQGCSPSMTLIPYGSQEGASVPKGSATMARGRMNSIKPGVYFIRTQAEYNFCKYQFFFSKA